MKMVRLDKNISLPQKGANYKTRYPWSEMEIGDSFIMHGTRNNVSTKASYRARKMVGNMQQDRLKTE